MLAALALASALAAPRGGPPTLHAPAEALAVCPASEVVAAQAALLDGRPTDEARRAHDRAIAAWAVCARLNGVGSYRMPALKDPASVRILTASLTETGRRTRIEALERAASTEPELVALLALEELGIMHFLQQVDPPLRLTVAAAAVGAWGCPHAREWGVGTDNGETAWCTDGRDLETMAREGVRQLVHLSQPTRDLEGWLADATRSRVDALWTALEGTWFPIEEPRPVVVPSGGEGMGLTPGLGWTLRISPEISIWTPRPRFHITRDGIVVPPPVLRTRAPEEGDGAPVAYVEGSVTVGELEMALQEQRVLRPRLVGQGSDGLLELRLGWMPRGSVPPADALVVDVVAGMTDLGERVAASSATGETWLRVPPGLPYAALVHAQGEVARARSHPVRFVVTDPG